ncbi:hypothetical protein QR680_013515 [Steinernema hermaphroditum]|uniref:Ran-GTPase activating protein 1 C-terminal domain-containing protein n=1 Tax=Steinernema hermaphroditum TaxID=289476 RepID=A0AA39M2M5_9BILA|nr:hypothetical protein QR680_013515 [Steinernema hermaphroditum]
MEAVLVSFLDRQLKVNSTEDAREIVQKISSTPLVEALELRGNTVGLEGGTAIASALETHPELKRALWSDMFTGKLKTEIPPILKTLCRAMMVANVQLVELDLSDNAFGPIGAEGIQEFLRSPSAFSLEHLKLNNCGLGAGGETIAQCLIDCHRSAREEGREFRLKTFVAGRNRLENPRAIALANAFETLKSLEEIEMYQDGINPDGIIALSAGILKNPNLRILNLSDNTFTSKGAKTFAKTLQHLSKLEVINFSDCLCRDSGSKAIIQHLSSVTHPNLREINLDGCEISADGAEALIGLMRERLPSVRLTLSTNAFGSRFEDLEAIAATHGRIEFGDIDDDEGTADEMEEDEGDEIGAGDGVSEEEILPELTEGKLVSFLDRQLKVNSVEDAREIVQKIRNTSLIEALEMRGNTVGLDGGTAIASALETHPELKRALWSDMFTGKLKTEIPPILKTLCRAMMVANVQLVELDLSDNAFGPIGAEGIQEFLRSPSAFSLEHLKLNNCGLGAGGETIAQCLIDCHRSAREEGREFRLKTFVAGRNRLENPRAIALANAFETLKSLEEIEMYQDGINPDGIIALSAGILKNPNLRILNLSDNTFTSKGAKAFAKTLQHLSKLEVINFSDCLCRDFGSKAIIQHLSSVTHPNLREINLDGCEISADGAEALIGLMRERLPSVRLTLSTNAFGSRFEDLEAIGATHGKIEFGDIDDDEGSADEMEEDEGGEMGDGDGVSEEEILPEPSEGKLVSFLDRQLKVNSADDAREIVQKIRNTPLIEALELRGNTVGLKGGTAIASALETHPELKRALWSDMFTGKLKTEIPPILKTLCRAMMVANVQLVELDLSDNAFGPIGAEGIQEFLRSPSAFSLEHLKLNNCGLGAGGETIAQCLIDCHRSAREEGREFRLKTFVAGRNRLENPRAIALANAFETLKSLEEIEMYQDGINPDGIIALSAGILKNPNLRILNLSDNTFTSKGAKAFAKTLQHLNKLEVINFSDCLCRDSGSKAIIQHLSSVTHPNLREINLDGCEISADGAEALIGLMRERLPSVCLTLSTNAFGSRFEDLEAIGATHGKIEFGDIDDDEGTGDEEEYDG